jgi:hypothetical protein
MLLIILLFLNLNVSWGWYCHEVASEKNGDVINSCGIAESTDEDAARKRALENAYRELDLICNKSYDCSGHGLEITPLRTECKKVNGAFICHRGISATILKEKAHSIDHHVQNVYVPKQITQIETADYKKKSTIVNFRSDPEGAGVYIDGVEICLTPCSREVAIGQHKIIYEKKDFELLSFAEEISDETTINRTLEFKYGLLKVRGIPGDAIIKVDQSQVSSQGPIKLLPKNYVITIIAANHQPWFQEIKIKKGETSEIQFSNQPIWGLASFSVSDRDDNAVPATLYVDDEKMDERTPTDIKIKSGVRRITLEHPDFKELRFEQDIKANEKTIVKRVLDRKNKKDFRLYLGVGATSAEAENFKKEKGYSCCLLIETGFQYMIYRNLGVSLSYKNNSNLEDSNEAQTAIYDTGTPNTTEYNVKSSQSNLFGLGLLYEFRREEGGAKFIEAEMGLGDGNLEYSSIAYNQFGYGSLNSKSGKISYEERYYNFAIGIDGLGFSDKSTDQGLYLKVGARLSNKKFDRSKAPALQGQDPQSRPVIGYVTLGWKIAF